MSKFELLQRINGLQDEVKSYENKAKLYENILMENGALKSENERLKKIVSKLENQVEEMSDPKALYDELEKYKKARTQIAINHNNVLAAFHRTEAHYKKMIDDFLPFMKQYRADIIMLSDEFTIPMDKLANDELFAVRDQDRVLEWEKRSQKLAE